VIEIAPAAAADLPRVAELAKASLEDPWPPASFEAELVLPEARLWVARCPDGEAGGRGPVADGICGYAVLRRVVDELHLLSLAVAPARRRRGVGRALLEHAIAGERDVRAVHLEVRADRPEARSFYDALGFVAVGRRPRYYRGREDAVLMTRSL
jgi:ribosomal-protein-alanine N-acetyltransferase